MSFLWSGGNAKNNLLKNIQYIVYTTRIITFKILTFVISMACPNNFDTAVLSLIQNNIEQSLDTMEEKSFHFDTSYCILIIDNFDLSIVITTARYSFHSNYSARYSFHSAFSPLGVYSPHPIFLKLYIFEFS